MRRLAAWILLCGSLPAATACGELEDVAELAGAFSRLAVRAPAALASVMQQDDPPVLRRLWVGSEPDFWASTPSPDGRYVSEIDWITGDLAVLDLLTGELRHVTDKGSWDEAVEWAEMSAFSPDGRELAYVYWNEDLWGYEIRVIDIDGSNERAVLPHRDGLEWISVDDWSDDGQILATLYWKTEGDGPEEYGEITLVSAETGEVRVLKTANWFGTWNARFSPDGRFIAYEARPEGQEDHDLFVLATDGSLDEVLLGGPTDERMMDWTPDGRSILFYRHRDLTEGIWRLPVRTGEATGEPEPVRADVWRATPIGFAGSSFYYGVQLESPQVHTASIDVEGGRLLTAPAPVEEPSGSRTGSGEWSPDGRYLAYTRRVPGESRPTAVVIRSIAGGETRELDVKLRQIQQILWGADSRSLLLFARNETDANLGLFGLDLESGELSNIVEPGAVVPDQWLFASPDRRTFYFSHWDSAARVTRIMAFNLDTLQEIELATTHLKAFRFAPSPDGRTLAFVQSDPAAGVNRLVTLSTGGGEIVELEVSAGSGLGSLDLRYCLWTPDGRFLLLTSGNDADGTSGLWRLPAAGGEPVLIAERRSPEPLFNESLRLSPDGKRIAFGSQQGRGEIWVMDNLSDDDETAQTGNSEPLALASKSCVSLPCLCGSGAKPADQAEAFNALLATCSGPGF
jgi:Tol biopolymer transport system component